MIDTSPNAVGPVLDAVESVRPEGTVVLAGMKDQEGSLAAVANAITRKAVTVRGAFSVSEWAKRQAIKSLGEGEYPVSRLHTHTLGLEDLDRAFRILGGEVPGEDALHITVVPTVR